MRIDKYYDGPVSHGDAHSGSEGREEQVHEHHSGIGAKVDSLLGNRYVFIALVLAILAITVIERAGLLKYQGLFEPDGFFYYAVVKQAISSHFIVSNYLNISGFPNHNFIGEAPGLLYLAVVSYWLVHGITGASSLAVIRWLPIAFGMLYALLAYLLAQYLTKSRALGLLSMLFVGLSSGNIARTAGAVFRGDSFITFFIMVALLFMLKCFEEKRHTIKYLWGALSGFALGSGIIIWNGSPFIVVIYMLALAFTMIYGFIKADKEVLFSSLILSFALLLAHIFEIFYIGVGLARPNLQFAGNEFFIFFLPLLIGAVVTYYIVRNIHRFRQLSTHLNRAILTLAMALVFIIIIFAGFGNIVKQLSQPLSPNPTGPVNATKQAIVATTQELQPPSYNFLWSSFNVQFIVPYVIGANSAKPYIMPIPGLAIIGMILFVLLAILLHYGERWVKREHFRLDVLGFLVIMAYFLITAYLQASAIRFNAIISVSVAIFAAFGLYAVGKLLCHRSMRIKGIGLLAPIIVAIVAIFALWDTYGGFGSSFGAVTAAIAFIYVLMIGIIAYSGYSLLKGRMHMKYVVIAFVLVLLTYNFYNTFFESYTAVQADGINPQFLQAMTWLKNNTASNATVLALWPDGSVVEGWGNRTSYMDSVGGENGTRIYPFAQYLFNTSIDSQYLYGIHKPEYLIARNFWYEELGGIAQEGLVQNASDYGYIILNQLNSTSNGTAQFFTFYTNTYPYYRSEMIVKPGLNGTTDYSAYLGVQNSTRTAEMRGIIFLNTSNSQYSMYNVTANNTLDYTLMVSYSGHVINGAYVFGPKLTKSNLFKFTFLCNYQTCPYNDSNVSMHAVYINGDTRIFRIDYLK